MSHFQISKTKCNKVFRSLEKTGTQRKIGKGFFRSIIKKHTKLSEKLFV